MQTFSNMRRNSTDQKYLKLFVFFIIMLLGQVISALYPFMPSFVGLFFCYVLINFEDKEKIIPLVFAFVYLVFYDINKDFYLFSYLILFLIFYHFAIYKIQNMTTCSNCILAVYVIVAYFGHYTVNFVLAYLENMPLPYFSAHYFYYIAIDALLAFMFFRINR